MAELLDRIADLGEPQRHNDLGGAPESFRITDLGGATWAMRKLATIRRHQDTIRQTAEAEINRIKEWQAHELKGLGDSADYFESLLIGYHRRRLAEDERAKTIKLPHGSLKCRAQQPEYIRNEDELLAWAEATDPQGLIEVKRSPRWSEIKKRGKPTGEHLMDALTGEVIPGVAVIEREPKFTVDVEVI